MDGSGRNFVSLNRFFSAQEIVRSNDENAGSNNHTIDGGSRYSTQYGQYSSNNPNQFQSSSVNAAIFGGSSNQYGQYDGHNYHNVGGPINAYHHFQPPPSNEAISGGPNQFGQYGLYTHHNTGTLNAPHQFRLSSNNTAVLGSPSHQYWQPSSNNPTNLGSNQYGQYDGRNIGPMNEFHHNQASSGNSAIYGVPSNQHGQHDPRYNYNIGGPANGFAHSQSLSNNSSMFGSFNGQHYGFNNTDRGVVSDTNETRQYTPSNNRAMYGGTNWNSEKKGHNNNDNGVPVDTINHSSENETQAAGSSYSNHVHGNAVNERIIDSSTRIEHAKLKAKIVDTYKEKASKPFLENSARFYEDEWLKVWYTLSNGLRSYQSQMTCPICYKKVTPQNRSEPGNLPRWELTIIKGHLDRLHSAKLIRANPANNEERKENNNEEDERKPAEAKTEMENEKEKKKNEETAESTDKEEGPDKIEKSKTTTEHLDLISSPESVRSVRESSSSSSEDERNSSSSSDDTAVPLSKSLKRRMHTRKQSSKRGKISSKKEYGIKGSQKFNTEVVVSDMRNLMKYSLKHILGTFSDHKKTLQQIYDKMILKKQYKPNDLPDFLAHDIMNDVQLGAMAEHAELKLAKEEHYNATDVIFDAILPEWALAEFCKEFNLTRTEAVQVIKKQNEALVNQAD